MARIMQERESEAAAAEDDQVSMSSSRERPAETQSELEFPLLAESVQYFLIFNLSKVVLRVVVTANILAFDAFLLVSGYRFV